MASLGIIEHVDVAKDIGAGQITSSVDSFLDALLFQAAEEGFDYRVVPTVAAATHARLQLVLVAEAQPVIATVLRALVQVNNH